MTIEHRFVPCEFRATAADTRTFEGYASVFGGVDSYNDTIAKGAFTATLREWKAKNRLPKLLLQHGGGFFSGGADDMLPVGKYAEMREDATGLFVKGRLFDVDTDRAKAVYAAMKEGELDGLSIGFRTRKSTMDNATGIRTLTDVQLLEVSLVVFPADDAARVTDVRTQGASLRDLVGAVDRGTATLRAATRQSRELLALEVRGRRSDRVLEASRAFTRARDLRAQADATSDPAERRWLRTQADVAEHLAEAIAARVAR